MTSSVSLLLIQTAVPYVSALYRSLLLSQA